MYQVKIGIDVLEEENFASLVGKRIGLITNQTGIDREWHSTIDILYKAKNVHLVALFSPEHGIRGIANSLVAYSVDSATDLPIYSLYSKMCRPTKRCLRELVCWFSIYRISELVFISISER
ncbi:MAG TPA: DUF1343 domain-containing protein [Ignavibacteria bacterium]|nr:DUF1343 domain-containing protein [Ignavibacteria bacterium]